MAYDTFVCDGSKLQMKIAAAYVDIPGVTDPTFSGSSKAEIEYTAISDTAAKFKLGRMNYGNFSFGLAYDPADATGTHTGLKTAADTPGSETEFKLILSDVGATEITFTAGVQAFDLSLKNQDVGRVQVNTKLNGAWTLTPTP